MDVVGVCFFSLSLIFFHCQGHIKSPPDGTSLVFVNGSSENITWILDDAALRSLSGRTSRRTWFFTSGGSTVAKDLAIINGDGKPTIFLASGLFGVSISKPATLILKNVNQTYNGTYWFTVLSGPFRGSSKVFVFIAITPKISVNCSSHISLNQGDYFACECKGLNGNPPANVTWFKGNTPVSSGKEEAILRVSSVQKEANLTYRCEAKSHEKARKETTIEIIVNYPPEHVKVISHRYGDSVIITCSAECYPPPSYQIFFYETLVSRDKMYYFIPEVNSRYVGNYTCVATNILGSKTSSPEFLTRSEPSTKTLAKISNTKELADYKTEISKFNERAWVIVVTLLSGFIIGVGFSHCISLYIRRRGLRKSKSEGKATEKVENSTYQELDVTKMNAEENYQSLNQTKPEPSQSAYQALDLSEMNDNYQSLVVNGARLNNK